MLDILPPDSSRLKLLNPPYPPLLKGADLMTYYKKYDILFMMSGDYQSK